MAWSGAAEAYRDSFASLCAGPVARLFRDLPRGMLLDVGCGPGDLIRRATGHGRQRDVVGVDPDPAMARLAASQVAGRVVCAALPALPFADGSFSAVAANFVVNHVADPLAAVRELARVLEAGGRVAMTIWPPGGAGWGPLLEAAYADAGVRVEPTPGLPAHLDFPRSVEGLSHLTEAAGLRVHEATELAWEWRTTPESLWLGIESGVATAGRTYLSQAPRPRARIREAFFCHAGEATTADGALVLPSRAVYVVAAR